MAIDISFLKQLNRLSILLNKRVATNFIGHRKAMATGRGLVFSDYARYTFGDDFRTIDWKVYARTDKLFVKRYEEERNLTVHIVLDFSASMNFGDHIKKHEYASMLGLGFAYVALKNNEKFVLSTFSEKLDFFKPYRGVKQIIATLDYLNKKKPQGQSKFYDSLIAYKKLIRSKSMVIIVSDFFYDPAEIQAIINRYKNNKIVLIQILDEKEKDLHFEGDYDLEDLETKSSLKTYIDPMLRKQYTDQMEDHVAKIKYMCNQVRAEFHQVNTAQDIFDVFYQILSTK